MYLVALDKTNTGKGVYMTLKGLSNNKHKFSGHRINDGHKTWNHHTRAKVLTDFNGYNAETRDIGNSKLNYKQLTKKETFTSQTLTVRQSNLEDHRYLKDRQFEIK